MFFIFNSFILLYSLHSTYRYEIPILKYWGIRELARFFKYEHYVCMSVLLLLLLLLFSQSIHRNKYQKNNVVKYYFNYQQMEEL